MKRSDNEESLKIVIAINVNVQILKQDFFKYVCTSLSSTFFNRQLNSPGYSKHISIMSY